MRIGIIGAGNLGTTVAGLFVGAGHEVAIANSRGPESLAGLVAELGHRARAVTAEEAATFGEMVLLAVPFRRYRDVPAAPLAGKVVIDAMNDYDGISDDAWTSSELLAAHLPEAHIVKTFTMYWELLRDRGHPARTEDRLVLFVAGDDEAAKAQISSLIDAIGFTPVDTGGLSDGSRRQQPGSPIYTELAIRRRGRHDPPGFTLRDARLALGLGSAGL